LSSFLATLIGGQVNITPLKVEYYADVQGNFPLAAWLDSLQDKKTLEIIYGRLTRLESGLVGDNK